MWFGWKTLYIDNDGNPTDIKTQWVASCFILFFWVIYVHEIKPAPHIGDENGK